MGNMSYCRFENTLNDLRDCAEALEDDQDDLSESETQAKELLIDLCRDIVEGHGE